MKEQKPICPIIRVTDTADTDLVIEFKHFDVTGEDWIEMFKVVMLFLGFGPATIDELFNIEEI